MYSSGESSDEPSDQLFTTTTHIVVSLAVTLLVWFCLVKPLTSIGPKNTLGFIDINSKVQPANLKVQDESINGINVTVTVIRILFLLKLKLFPKYSRRFPRIQFVFFG